MSADFQIIGGGLIGLSLAYALLRRGAGSVRIIEARSGVALETSYANAGMVHASLAQPWNTPGIGCDLVRQILNPHPVIKLNALALPKLSRWGLKFLQHSRPDNHWYAARHNYELAQYSAQINRKWRKELCIEDSYERDGLLKIFRHEKDFLKAKLQNKHLETLGLSTEYLTASAAVKKEPALKAIETKLTGAIYFPNDFKADAYLFCRALEAEIVRLGGHILTHTKMQSFIKSDGKIIGVKTRARDFMARTTIMASGAHTHRLVRPLGISLPVRPVKGYSLTFKHEQGEQHLPKIPVVDDSLHVAITPLKGCIRIAGIAELAGFNGCMPPRQLQRLLAMLRNVYPSLAEDKTIADGTAWHGFRPMSADGIPFVGHTNIPGLAINTGHGHMGWTFSAGSGALLADILMDRRPKFDTVVFSPQR